MEKLSDVLTSRVKVADITLVNVPDVFMSKGYVPSRELSWKFEGKKYDDVRQHILKGVLKQFRKEE